MENPLDKYNRLVRELHNLQEQERLKKQEIMKIKKQLMGSI